jgi:DnaJ family protein C protein 7
MTCTWKGDYGDLESHLLSSTAHVMNQTATEAEASQSSGSATASQLSLANSLKAQANTKFESGHYREARSLYTKAIEVLAAPPPSSTDEQNEEVRSLLETLHSNRAATYLQTQQFPLCLQDCQTILQHWGTSNPKVYLRASRACLQLGDLGQATRFLGGGLEQSPNNAILKKEMQKIEGMVQMEDKARADLQKEQFATAKGAYGTLLKEAPSAVPFLLGAAQADLGLGLTDSALRLTKRVLTKHAQNPIGCWIRGRAAFLMGDGNLAIQLMQEALRLDPDSQEIKNSYKQSKQVHEWMLLAQKTTFERKFDQTVDLITKCLDAYRPLPAKSTLYANLYTQRAEAHLRLKRYSEAIKDCALVVYAQEDCIPAWLIRFQAHHGLGEHAIALDHVRDLLQKWPQDPRLRLAYERADFLLRKEKRVDFYELLGVPSIASDVEIRKAYKRKALELHPDKAPPDQQQVAQRRFQQLGQALEILTDDFQRKLWDEGYDPDAIRESVEAANQAAHRGHHHGGGGHHHGHSHY